MAIDYNARMAILLEQVDADVVALVPGANMIYFTGLHVHLSERPTVALLSADGLAFIMPELEMIKLSQRPDLEAKPFIWGDSDGFEGAFAQAVSQLGLASGKKLAVDGQTMRVFEWLAFAQHDTPMETAHNIGQQLLYMRSRKTPAEIEALREAIRITEKALERTLEWTQIGMTEIQISNKLKSELSALGSEGLAFEPAVLTGSKSALPHGNTATRPLGENDFLLIDFGGMKNDYPADITRTFCLGDPTDQMREIYEAVKAANEAACAIAKPGVPCGDVDKAARSVIEAAGYGDYFTHRTGHGLGLEVHELPQIAAGNDLPLEVGMVFTVEPGIYVPEVGGVRIEDNVVVTEDGVEVLTTYSREL